MKRWLPLLIALLTVAGIVGAQNYLTANQGQPGTQGPWPVSIVGGNVSIIIGDGGLTVAQGPPGAQPWPVFVQIDGGTVPVGGTVTANQGTTPWVVAGTDGGSWISNYILGGTSTVNQGTSPWVVSGAVTQGGAPWTVIGTDGGSFVSSYVLGGTVTANQGTSPWVVSGAVTQGTTPWVVAGAADGGSVPVNTAASMSAVTTEVLVTYTSSDGGCTAMPTTALANRRSVEIQNNGTAPLYCRLGTGALVRYVSASGGTWAADITDAISACCAITDGGNQVTLLGTAVTEIR